MSESVYDPEGLKQRMEGALDVFRSELSGLRVGRASTAMLSGVQVEVYGSSMPLDQVSNVSVPEPRLISVQVWDKSTIPFVEKAVRESGLGIHPVTDGQTIKLRIPEVNEERRKEYVKLAHKYAEQARISVRQVRRLGMEALKKAEKDKEIGEDAYHAQAAEIQKITDKFIKDVDTILAKKEKEIMTV